VTEPVGCFGWALLPSRRFADFRGRSRRTELVAYYLLFWVIGPLVLFALFLTRLMADIVGWLFLLAMLCPAPALAVRRLHDTGRSGRWLLLLVPGLILDLWRDFVPAAVPDPDAFELLIALSELAGLGLLILLLWKDDPEPNRYGPNPRFDPPEPEDQALA
jgi:uncharacterized membrane protein YhaH (DUF805 family)